MSSSTSVPLPPGYKLHHGPKWNVLEMPMPKDTRVMGPWDMYCWDPDLERALTQEPSKHTLTGYTYLHANGERTQFISIPHGMVVDVSTRPELGELCP